MITVKECDHRFVPKMVREFFRWEYHLNPSLPYFDRIKKFRSGFAIGVCSHCQATQDYRVTVDRRTRPLVTTYTPIDRWSNQELEIARELGLLSKTLYLKVLRARHLISSLTGTQVK